MVPNIKKQQALCENEMARRDTIVLHHLLLITIKRATMCISQRPIKRKDMHVGGFARELHDTCNQ